MGKLTFYGMSSHVKKHFTEYAYGQINIIWNEPMSEKKYVIECTYGQIYVLWNKFSSKQTLCEMLV